MRQCLQMLLWLRWKERESQYLFDKQVTHTAFHVPCISYNRIVLKVSLRPIKRYTSIQCEFPFPSSLFSFINSLSIRSSSLSYLNDGICNRGAGSSGIVIALSNWDSDELLLQEMWALQIKRVDPSPLAYIHDRCSNRKKSHENFNKTKQKFL